MKKKWMELLTEEVTLKKREVWLIAGVALFAGITFGLRKAPWTHGVMIGCNNANGNTDCCQEEGEEE